MFIVAIIPARMASSRFPGKPLKPILGLSMIEHVWRRVSLCDFLDDVVIATCDREIVQEAERFGAKAIMTSETHESCLDRVAEAAEHCKAEIVMNVQGDMPLIYPESLKKLVIPLLEEKNILFTDMIGPIEENAEFANPNVVKVVTDLKGHAVYYSREAIPSLKKLPSGVLAPRYKQFGVNAFRREALIRFSSLPRTPLEKIESVDMLRLLENGFKVRIVVFSGQMVGVDTSRDLEKAEELMRKDSLFLSYTGKLTKQ